jgi:hypothetical protein
MFFKTRSNQRRARLSLAVDMPLTQRFNQEQQN